MVTNDYKLHFIQLYKYYYKTGVINDPHGQPAVIVT